MKGLRDENAKYRKRAKRADDLARRLVTSYAASTGKLADPTDLPYSDDLLNDDGTPDEEKIANAIDDLIKTKPHLASRRPSGDVGQGARPEEPEFNLVDLLRGG